MTSKSKKFYIICAAVTLAVLAIAFALIQRQRAAIAPLYELTVKGLCVDSPDEAQAACRAKGAEFKKISDKYKDCCWVWCGDEVVYLAKTSALKLDVKADKNGYTAVKFSDEDGERHKGYIIYPEPESKELGRIKLSGTEEYTYDSVSMTIRVGIRKGDISYKDAVYLWEKGSAEVIAVRPDSYEPVEGKIVSFTDDGGINHTCYILDTEI